MKQVIYIDILLCINFIFSFFALLSVIKILKIKCSSARIFLGSTAGALSSMVVLLPEMNFFFSLAVRIIVAFIVILSAFYPVKFMTVIKSTACFFMVSFIFCGVMIALWFSFKPKGIVIRNGSVYFEISPMILIVSTLISYIVLRILSRLTGREKNKSSICKIELFFNDKHIILYGMVDSGNTLKEPFSELPVIIVSKKALKDIISPDFFMCTTNVKYENRINYRIIPFNSIGGDGFLQAFQADELYLISDKTKTKVNAYIAVSSAKRFSGEFNAIVPSILFE